MRKAFATTCVLIGLGLLSSLIHAGAPTPAPVTATMDKEKKTIDFMIGKELVTRFYTGKDYPKQILWPLNAPGEVPLTRSWPMVKSPTDVTSDHVHHRSLWVGHVSVTPVGMANVPAKGINFWEEPSGHGNVICTKVEEPTTKDGAVTVVSKHEWRTKDDVLVLHEDRVMVVKNLGNARLITFDFDLYPEKYPIIFGDDKDGFFGTRINDQIVAEKKGKGKIQNAEGKIGEGTTAKPAAWGYPSAWCDYSGPIDGKQVGLAVLVDPTNKYPSTFHVRAYGLMAANPFGKTKSFPGMKGKTDTVRLEVGEHLKLRYGVLMHEGDADSGKVAEHYKTFVGMKEAEKK